MLYSNIQCLCLESSASPRLILRLSFWNQELKDQLIPHLKLALFLCSSCVAHPIFYRCRCVIIFISINRKFIIIEWLTIDEKVKGSWKTSLFLFDLCWFLANPTIYRGPSRRAECSCHPLSDLWHQSSRMMFPIWEEYWLLRGVTSRKLVFIANNVLNLLNLVSHRLDDDPRPYLYIWARIITKSMWDKI